MDECGVTETNDPAVRVVWEREGREVRLALNVDPRPESPLSFDLPPMADPPPVDAYRLSTRPGIVGGDA